MDDKLDDAAIGSRTFSQARRGYDRREVDEFRDAVSQKIASLSSELAELKARIHQVGLEDPRDLKAEFDAIGGEVEAILQAARTAAEEIRSRASADAARWRSEAETHALAAREAADRQAFQLRESAWEAGTAMLDQASAAADEVARTAEQETLFIRAEAEREALRMTGDARRDAEEERRAARTEAERLLLEARAKSESIIETARQSAEAAQQRTQALEERRSELMSELEAARESIGQLEHEIESRRDALFHTGAEPSGMRVISAEPADDDVGWLDEDAAGVRVVPVAKFESEPVDADAMADEVRRMRQTVARGAEPIEAVVSDAPADEEPPPDLDDAEPALEEIREAARISEVASEPDTTPQPDTTPEPEPEPQLVSPEPEPEPMPEAAPEPMSAPEPEPMPEAAPEPMSAAEPEPVPALTLEADDQLSDLFATLRSRPAPEPAVDEPAASEAVRSAEDSPAIEEPTVLAAEPLPAARDLDTRTLAAAPSAEGAGRALVTLTDPFELRDRLLLPVENRALRTVKRRLVDLQNRVLEDLRVDGPDWAPDGSMFRAAIGDELTPVRHEAYVAGLGAASELAGRADVATPSGTPPADPTPDFVDALVAAVGLALNKERAEGSGARQVSASVSKVFRAWRTDEAERRTRWSARAAYHQGICDGLNAIGVPLVTAIAPGRPCGKCPAGTGRAWDPADTPPDGLPLPPASPECAATIVPAASPER